MEVSPLQFSWDLETLHLTLKGSWCLDKVPILQKTLDKVDVYSGSQVLLDGSGLEELDTGGGYLLLKYMEMWRKKGAQVDLANFDREYSRLLDLLYQAPVVSVCTRPMAPNPFYQMGQWAHAVAKDSLAFFNFLGEACITGLYLFMKPFRIPWKGILYEIEEAGSRAIPIVLLVALLAGVVISYQGALQLRRFGASIFMVDLLAISMAREMAPLLTAIMVAGRSGSSYTAQIGTMKVNEEIDALRTLGISPMQVLVMPKLWALVIVLPLLIFLADLVGIGGGMVISRHVLGITFHDFLSRLHEALPLRSFLVGILKGPVFAIPLGLISCFRGFQVEGSTESVGRYTTISVVNTIFAVIAIDAVLSVILGNLGI